MAQFTVNGKTVTVEKNQKLMRYLRDELRLLSVKDGCAEGACGACTIIIDGKTQRACIPMTDKMEGKSVLTVEGLSDFEKQVFTYAFGEAGSVQCGFCIPGMVMCAKALIDQNPDPTREEAAFAIRNNICRCTGYVKIIDGILLAAKILREGKIPEYTRKWAVGERTHRQDIEGKVLGTGKYTDDYYLDNMCHGSAVRSAYPRAKVLAIHTEEAKALPGVVAVFTADDIPGNKVVGHLFKDWDTMIGVGEITRFLGDAIALVVAETPEILEQAKKLVKVDYEVLPAVHNPKEAAAEGAPLVHEKGNLLAYKGVHRGNAEEAIKNSKYVLSGHFTTPWNEHAFLEPECAVAFMKNDHVFVYTSDQSVYDTLHETAPMLGLPYDQVEIENTYVGGGFGGKEDVTVQHLAALITYLTGRAVKVKLTRAESLIVHPKRHPFEVDMTIGCDENGIIQGMQAKCISDTGAYASLGAPVLERACTHASGPYNYQNFDIDGWAYYTNNPPAGAFRGFGVTQTCFATETLLNQMAEKIGISPWEIRFRNAIRPGQTLPNAQIVGEDTGLVETLLAVKDEFENAKYAGIACCMKNAGLGHGIPDWGRCRLVVEDGKVIVCVGASDMGQGASNVFCQNVGQVLNLPADKIVYRASNSFECPDSGTSSGSRQTTVSGDACRVAALNLKAALDGHTLEDLNGQEFYGEWNAMTDKPDDASIEHPLSHVCYGYATQVCILDDNGKVKKIIAAHDVGKAINPMAVEGQIEGGVVMSLGYTLTEAFPIDDNCRPTAKYGTLGLWRAHQIPEIESIIVEREGFEHSFGAKGVGEIVSIPTSPAIAAAYHAYDGEWRYNIPLTNTPYARKKK